MPLKYSKHALRRMRQRRISETWVEATIKNPEFSHRGRLDRTISLKRYGDRLLKVVHEKRNDEIMVITVYWTRAR